MDKKLKRCGQPTFRRMINGVVVWSPHKNVYPVGDDYGVCRAFNPLVRGMDGKRIHYCDGHMIVEWSAMPEPGFYVVHTRCDKCMDTTTHQTHHGLLSDVFSMPVKRKRVKR